VRPEDLAWTTGALGRPGGKDDVRVRWLGTAGFAIEHAGHVLLLDPYVTRASLASCVALPLRPNVEAIARHVPRADAIVLGHTHFDHALDVPEIALRTGARVFGSRSAAALCRAKGVAAERVEVVEDTTGSSVPVEREVGPFALRFVPSAHSKFLFGRVPAPGDIADCDDVPMRVNGYKCGAVFGVEIRVAGRTLYHVGSADLIDANVRVKHVDLLLLCVAGWTTTPEYPERVAHRFAPGAILLSHWDNFLRPIERPARALPAMQLPRLVDRLSSAARGVKIGTLPLLGEVWT
jgi:L-ascorbate metabolism protein UlaG (beta-lactamase superfamily)